eukprot:7391122-Prymnesium_polylepis.1
MRAQDRHFSHAQARANCDPSLNFPRPSWQGGALACLGPFRARAWARRRACHPSAEPSSKGRTR